jgi:hypothetical protein
MILLSIVRTTADLFADLGSSASADDLFRFAGNSGLYPHAECQKICADSAATTLYYYTYSYCLCTSADTAHLTTYNYGGYFNVAQLSGTCAVLNKGSKYIQRPSPLLLQLPACFPPVSAPFRS